MRPVTFKILEVIINSTYPHAILKNTYVVQYFLESKIYLLHAFSKT